MLTEFTSTDVALPRRRSAIVALLLNVFGMGAGYLYLARPKRALALIAWTLASIAASFHGLGGWLASPAGFVTYLAMTVGILLAMVIDTILIARRSQTRPQRWFNRVAIYLAPVALWIGASFLAEIPSLGLQRSVQTFVIPSSSMEPNIVPGDRIAADMGAYRRQAPKRGDVAMVRHASGSIFITRVIGLPGERVALKNGVVQINGTAATMDAVTGSPIRREKLPGAEWTPTRHASPQSPLRTTTEVTLPPGHYFLLGDNRDNSVDSRMSVEQGGLGLVSLDRLLGKATFVFWSRDTGRIGLRL